MPKQQKQKIGGNKAKSRQHVKNQGYYKQRFFITEKNRRRKRLKHLKSYPQDLQTARLFELDKSS